MSTDCVVVTDNSKSDSINGCTRCKNKSTDCIQLDLLPCGNEKCKKVCHHTCFVKKYSKQDWFKGIDDDSEELVFCNKTCYKQAKKNNTRPLWTNDGPKGTDDPNHSMKHLIDWLTTGDNWIKYKGKNNSGKSKSQFAKEIASFINSTGVKETRSAEQVRVKIDAIEKAYKIADNFVNNTGVGLKEDDPDNFEDVVRNKFFPYYFELEPIFRDHASISPVMTNKDLSNESSEEESDSDDSSVESVFMTPKVKVIENVVTSSKRGKDEDANENNKKIKSSEKEKQSNKVSANKNMKNVKKGIPKNNESKMDEYLSSKKKQCDNDCENTSIINKMDIIKQVKDLHVNQGFSESKIRRWFPELKDVVDIYFEED